MHKVWIVARREYLTNLKRPGFLFAAFGTPLLFLIIFGISFVMALRGNGDIEDMRAVGYVDNAALLANEVTSPEYPELTFIAYPDSESARVDLDEGVIEAYFILPEDYMETGAVQLYSVDSVPLELNGVIRRALVESISASAALDLPVDRIIRPVDEMMVTLQDSGREISETALPALLLLPLFFAVIFSMASQITSGFLMGGLVEEKTNRIMEILVTSITPMQMLTGKVLGLGLLGLTQLVIWVGAAVLVLTFGDDLAFLSGVGVPVDLIVVAVIYFILGYFFMAAIMSGIGAVSDSEQESRQYAGVFSLFFFIPYFFLVAFIEDPNGTAPVALSIFPFTSPMAMVIRVGMTAVPTIEMVASIGVLIVSTLLATWSAARVFRWGLLMYGKKINPRELLKVILGGARDDLIPAGSPPAKKEVSA